MSEVEQLSEGHDKSRSEKASFRRALAQLLGINGVGFALSVGNEIIDHSALGFTQATMEGVDSAMAVGLVYSHNQDMAGNHRRASRFRQGLYVAHIGIAGVGIAESLRLMNEGSEPTVANVAISGLVAILNMHYLRHRRKHRKNIAHSKLPTIEMAFADPTEVLQDEKMGTLQASELHRLNEDGIFAIAKTNVAESLGGVIGAASYVITDQGPAVAAITSSAAVIYIMASQIKKDRSSVNAVESSTW